MKISKNSQKNITSMVAIAGFSAMFLSVPAFAFNEATLSGIEISSFNDASYNIVLKTDKTIPIEKEITNDNKIVLDLKNVKPASFVNTIYNNASQIDNVVIQPISDNRVKIFIEGRNVVSSMIKLGKQDVPSYAEQPTSNSYIDTNNVSAVSQVQPASNTVQDAGVLLPKSITNLNENPVPEAETVVIKPSVSSFKPLDNIDEVNQATESPIDSVKNSLVSSGILKSIVGSSPVDWGFRFLSIILLIIAGMKILNPKKKNVKIDLYGDIRSREVELLKEINNRRSPILPGLKDTHRTNYNRVNSELNVRSRYGIQEYQNNQTPYTKKPINKPLPDVNRKIGMTKVKSEASFSSLKTKSTAPAQKTLKAPNTLNTSRVTDRNIKDAKVNINGVKFLENMAKIYEKSGRGDLAQGIQNNISRSSISLK